MNRQRILKQRAARHGLYVQRSLEGPANAWDIIDAMGPQGLSLTRRAAINRAGQMARKTEKVRMYVSDASGSMHRWNCEKVAAAHVRSHPCKCQRLDVQPFETATRKPRA